MKKQEVKLELDDIEESEIDKIISGNRSEVTVLFEDDKVLAYSENKPEAQQIAKVHFIVVAKNSKLASFAKVQEG